MQSQVRFPKKQGVAGYPNWYCRRESIMNHRCPFRKNLMQDLTASFLPGSRNKAGLLNKKNLIWYN
jgi:hypothetical protein